MKIASRLAWVIGLGCAALVAAVVIQWAMREAVVQSEVATVGDLRNLLAAEAAYASKNGGWYDTAACLGDPTRCIPGLPGGTPPFLDARIASLQERNGYRREFHAGLSAPADLVARGRISRTSISRWAYTATPARRSWWRPGGIRSFCVDSTPNLCADPLGGRIEPRTGRCPETCYVMG